jgi:Xaa-Pro aminopeptidase
LRIQEALDTAGLAAIVCSLPSNVLVLTGYWPVVGDSIAICVRGGPTILLVPEDELELADQSFADSVETFVPETLHSMTAVSEAVKPPLADILRKLKIPPGPIGIESEASSQATSYLAVHLYGNELPNMLHDLLPKSTPTPIEEWIQKLKSIKTTFELGRIREACAIAKGAYERAAPQLRAGMTEFEAAELLRAPLGSADSRELAVQRWDGFAFCMSGPNSAKASAAYARTRSRVLEPADLVMMHCNSYVDGFWTDITRTYTLQPPDEQQTKMYAAVSAARDAALSAIKLGARARDVDLAASEVIRDCGLGSCLRHGTGHGVGFSPMSAYSIPRIHAESPDVLQEGMVFNVEPAVYIHGYGGVRHCDMVVVTRSGPELLTGFQSDIASLTIINPHATREQHGRSRSAFR